MKTVLVILFVSSFFLSYNTDARKDRLAAEAVLPAKHTINFREEIQPIFKQNCSPCHFPGGKMYEKMPFDKAGTIVRHREGIIKRLEKEEQKTLVQQFLQQQDTAR